MVAITPKRAHCQNKRTGIKRTSTLALLLFFATALGVFAGGNKDTPENALAVPQTLLIYTSRNYDIDQVIFDSFSDKTGVGIRLVSGSTDSLLERLKSEQSGSDMDLLFLTDAGRLSRAKEHDLLQTIDDAQVFAQLKSPVLGDVDRNWIAVTYRARVLAYDKRLPKPQISSYEELATNPDLEILVRSSSNTYNNSLISYLIDKNGEAQTRTWTKSMADKFVRIPQGNDRDQMRILAQGLGNIAIVNSYYVGLLAFSETEADREVGNNIGLIFPSPTNINISGVGIGKYSKNYDVAIQFIRHLLSEEVQSLLTEKNFEYPVVDSVETNRFLGTLGTPEIPEGLDMNNYQRYSTLATQIADESGWN